MQKIEMDNPVLVNVIRGGKVESTHRGSAVVVDARGQTVYSIGNPDRMIYPRSALKYIQTIPLVESGAADSFALTDREIALASASHKAESFHVEAVTTLLARLGLDEGALECGAALPDNETAAHALIASGKVPTRAHHNCSGKHTGMLVLAQFLGIDTKGYSEYHHATQKAWMQVLGELIETNVFDLHWERDGCGLPAIYMPMNKLAYGYARYANTGSVGGVRGEAMSRILNAIRKHPEMIAGSDRCCSSVIKLSSGKIMVKTGAEGVFAGCIPDRGLGFALKVDDGAGRGSEVVLGALLNKLNALDTGLNEPLTPWFRPQIRNSQGKITGRVEASGAWG